MISNTGLQFLLLDASIPPPTLIYRHMDNCIYTHTHTNSKKESSRKIHLGPSEQMTTWMDQGLLQGALPFSLALHLKISHLHIENVLKNRVFRSCQNIIEHILWNSKFSLGSSMRLLVFAALKIPAYIGEASVQLPQHVPCNPTASLLVSIFNSSVKI